MKTRDSGMPDESLWSSFFMPELILDRLALKSIAGDVLEFGCGYGTFTIPAARRTTGLVHALDIEQAMIAAVAVKSRDAHLENVRPIRKDFVANGTGLPSGSVVYAMLFNILHAEESPAMLAEALRTLAPDGLLGVIHWNYNPATPRGPSMEIRPRPEQLVALGTTAGFRLCDPGVIDLPPWHYGMVFRKSATQS